MKLNCKKVCVFIFGTIISLALSFFIYFILSILLNKDLAITIWAILIGIYNGFFPPRWYFKKFGLKNE